MKRVAFVTCSEFPKLSESDRYVIPPLEHAGITVTATPWDRNIPWESFSSIILRSCWNYHYRYDNFIDWLNQIEHLDIPLWNPAPLVHWNSRKTYLQDIAKKNIQTIPTVYLTQGVPYDLTSYFRDHDEDEIVVKPTIGASAYQIFSVTRNTIPEGQRRLNTLLASSDCMVQPLMERVRREGEYSFIFINGIHTHTVLKTPPKGDFRSNYQFGSRERLIVPDTELLGEASRVVSSIDKPTLYARVDGVRGDDGFVLMELELIEPHLFFDLKPQSAIQFANAITSLL